MDAAAQALRESRLELLTDAVDRGHV